MQFQLTTVGQQAAANAQQAGLKLVFGNFSVGSGVGYTPNSLQTSLQGTLLYTGQITNYAKTAVGNLQFQLILDNTVGDFAYGEVEIQLADGTPFAFGVLPKVQQKYALPSSVANQVVETCQLVLSGGTPQIQWVSQPLTVGSIPELASFDLLSNPAASTSNTQIVHAPDDYGNHPLVYTEGAGFGLWNISTHQFAVYNDTVAASVVGSPTFNGHINKGIGTFPLGRFLIQFTSGASKGLIRQVTNIAGVSITMDTALGINTGDAFTIYQSTMSYIALGAAKLHEVRMYHGLVADIPQVFGPGWQLADGTNNTADLRGKFVIGAGGAYAPGATGGGESVVLTTNNLPPHSHTVNDPGHAHSLNDPGHNHAVYDPGHVHGINDPGHGHGLFDPGHNHGLQKGGSAQAGADNGGAAVSSTPNGYGTGTTLLPTQSNGTGIGIAAAGSNLSINGAGTGIGIYTNTTGITVRNATTDITTASVGNGTPIDIRPPYFALCFVEYIGA
jgi:hypothetical protein